MTEKRWQDILNLILGVWLLISPMVIGMTDTAAAWNAYILGVAIIVFSAIAVSMPRAWEEIVNIVLGVWMIISPWVLGYSMERSATINAVVFGILVGLFAILAMIHDKGFERWWHDHHHHAT